MKNLVCAIPVLLSLLLLVIGYNYIPLQTPYPSIGAVHSEQQEKTDSTAKPPNRNKYGSTKNPIIVQLATTKHDEDRADKEAETELNQTAINRDLLKVTGLLAVLAFLQWGIYCSQACLMQRGVNASIEAAKAAWQNAENVKIGERAYVFGGGPTQNTLPNKTHDDVCIEITNRGKTPAIIKKVQWGLHKEVDFRPYADMKVSEIIGKNLLKLEPYGDGEGSAEDICPPTGRIEVWQASFSRERDERKIIFGQIDYEDVFGKPHYSTFKLRLVKESEGCSIALPGCYSDYDKNEEKKSAGLS